MASFQCRVLDAKGEISQSIFSADSEEELTLALQGRGMHLISIEKRRTTVSSEGKEDKPLGKKQLMLFCHQLEILLRSGVSMVQSFDIIASQLDARKSKEKRLKRSLQDIANDVRMGESISSSMKKQGKVYPEMLISMIEVGEATGEMNEVLSRMAAKYQNDGRIAAMVRKALTTPALTLLVLFVVCIFMIVVVVPQFQDIYSTLGIELPAPTKVIISISDFFTKRWYAVVAVAVALFLCLKMVFRQSGVRLYLDKKILTAPVIRNLSQKVYCSLLMRSLQTLVSSGVPLVQSLNYANNSISNRELNGVLEDVTQKVSQGKSMAAEFGKCEYFPALMTSMVSIGENSGNLEEMFSKTADFYDEEVQSEVSTLVTLIEPTMMVLIGTVVCGLLIAIYLPMFQLIQAAS